MTIPRGDAVTRHSDRMNLRIHCKSEGKTTSRPPADSVGLEVEKNSR